MDEKLQPIKQVEIEIGKPLKWSVYDKFGRLLLGEGAIVESQRQLEGLCENGLFRESRDGVVARKESTGESEAASGKPAPVENVQDLLSVRLGIGDAVQLQDFSYEKQRYFVKLIGFMNRRSVLVSHPKQDEKLIFIKEGHGFQLRGFAGTKTYEFTSNVISVCLTPYPYLHLTFPTQVKTTSMRAAVRIKLRMVCSIESKVTGLKMPSIIEDMSISGARIHAKNAFGKVGEEVLVGLRMQIEGENQVFLVPSLIRNVHTESDAQTGGKIFIHGLEFVQSMSLELTMLQNFIYKSMLEH